MPQRLAKKILLVGWDAADWKILSPLIDAGEMPAFASLVSNGCVGNIATLQPMLSPMLWTSIVTGKRAAKHGIHGFVEPTPDGRSIRPVSSTSRTCKAVWNICHQAGLISHAVGFYASHPAEPLNGFCVSNQFAIAPADESIDRVNWRMPPEAVHPAEIRDSVAALRVHPREISDADLLPLIPKLAEVDRSQDHRPAELARILAKSASAHAVITGILQSEPWDFAAVYLDAIDHASHHFMPFHPPRLPHVNEREFELYRDVIVGVYKFHDLMLARLLQLAGDATVIVVSDHGFHSDNLRPATPAAAANPRDEAALDAAWHRPLGVIALAGPGIKKDERVYGANLLDVTPTILALLGLPLGEDMDGKVLGSAIDANLQIERIESWDKLDGDAGMHPPEHRGQTFDTAESLRQLVAALGYIAPLEEDEKKNVDRAIVESKYNLAISQIDAGRAADALPILRQLHDEQPADDRFVTPLAQCLHLLGEPAEAAALLEDLVQRDASTPDADLLLAAARFNTGQTSEAIDLLHKARGARPGDGRAHRMLGTAMLQLGRFADAEMSFNAALAADENDHEALDGLSVALFQQHRFEPAADAALRAVGIVHHAPQAHLHLGMALAHMGEHQRAIGPLEIAVRIQPKLLDGHRYLATMYRKLGHRDLAAKHRAIAESLIKSK